MATLQSGQYVHDTSTVVHQTQQLLSRKVHALELTLDHAVKLGLRGIHKVDAVQAATRVVDQEIESLPTPRPQPLFDVGGEAIEGADVAGIQL